MRAASVALVLIMGAAVVLWYGNMLNSWVLGGLIGGLAALLLSIPISLTLFSYLAHRHNEQLKAETQEEVSLARLASYQHPRAPLEVYEAESDMPTEEEQDWQELDHDYRETTGRNLPVPIPYPPLPAARQYPASENPIVRQRVMPDDMSMPERDDRKRQSKDAPVVRAKGPAARRLTPPGQLRSPGFPAYQGTSYRSLHQTAALRAARREAAAQYEADCDMEVYPTNTSRRLPTVRPEQSLPVQSARPRVPQQPRSPRQLQSPSTQSTSSVPPTGRVLPRVSKTSMRDTQDVYSHEPEPQTDQFGHFYPETGPLRQPPSTLSSQQSGRARQFKQPGHVARHPQVDAQLRDTGTISGSLKKPLVRRAPYMYEDDPLREELAQKIDNPSIRRSSRNVEYEEEEY